MSPKPAARTTGRRRLTLRLLPGKLAVCRLPPGAALPRWARGPGLVSFTRTAEELSVVVPERRVPRGVRAERGFRALGVQGPLTFSQVGVVASLAGPLARARISIFIVSTFDTDYVLVRDRDLGGALRALRAAGHRLDV